MKLGIPIYDGVNLLDVAGTLEMSHWAGRNNLKPLLVSSDGDTVKSFNGVRFKARASFAEAPALDILWVPGEDPNVLEDIMREPT